LSKIHDIGLHYLNNFDIKLLPVRNILDSALSAGVRSNATSTEFYINDCKNNINLFNKFKSKVDLIFRYEDYSVNSIKKLCTILNISIDNNDIIDIMIQLENMLNSKDIVKRDDINNKEYQKTLLSQSHNTSNGKTNKFINFLNHQWRHVTDSLVLEYLNKLKKN
jgi:hypothetical protein